MKYAKDDVIKVNALFMDIFGNKIHPELYKVVSTDSSLGLYSIELVHSLLMTVDYVCSADDLENHSELNSRLPIGSQNLLGKACDCGGFKTYGSMEEQYHSKSLPCSSLNGN